MLLLRLFGPLFPDSLGFCGTSHLISYIGSFESLVTNSVFLVLNGLIIGVPLGVHTVTRTFGLLRAHLQADQR